MFSSRHVFNQCIVLLITFLFVFYAQPVLAGEHEELPKVFEISLEELLSMDVSIGTLTGMERSKIPAAITIITREDIEQTPARNILDLIEVYVPGAMLRNSAGGPQAVSLGGAGKKGLQNNLARKRYIRKSEWI